MGCFRNMCRPGNASLCFVCLAWTVWFIAPFGPLVRTPLPYTPTLLPDNFTSLTTYTLLSAYSEYSPFDYVESGDVLKVESFEDKMRNRTLRYRYQQSFDAATCNYAVYDVVTGYEWTGDTYEPQGDAYPVLQTPRCDALVTFRALVIILLVLPFLSFFLSRPSRYIEAATRDHNEYEQLFVVVADGNRRGEGQLSRPREPPSPSVSSAPPSYNAQPGYTIDLPDPPAERRCNPPPVAVAHVMFHDEPSDPPPPGPLPAYQPPPPPRRQRGPRRYLPQANVERAAMLVQSEGAWVRKAVRQTWMTVLPAALSVALSLGALVALASFVSNKQLGEPREVQWGTWLTVASIGPYVAIVLIECAAVIGWTTLVVRRYAQKEGASLRSAMC